MKLRIKFSKHGPIVFIGHLDMMRYFQKAMRRAEVDISYSGGFSPHQIMSFAAPLGVGLASNGEYMDIGVDSLTSAKQVKDALNNVMVEGVQIESVKLLPDNVTNAMASVAAAKYTVSFRSGYEPDVDFFCQIGNYLSREKILVTKETKKGPRDMDLKPHIYDFSYEREANAVTLMVDASSAGNIKPGFVLQDYYKFCGKEAGEFDFLITREDTYTNIGTEDAPSFVPLDYVGEDY
ncbi:MAG: DUF2344 domain-containing protein [Lachnospiraceae bacterium]|nr:DUF2344 domain-containing protein [Lachnospiraceae bacterium]